MAAIRKSFKRELAVAGIAFWFVITVSMFWFMEATRITALHDPYFAATYSIWGYAAAAFGLHAIATQFGGK